MAKRSGSRSGSGLDFPNLGLGVGAVALNTCASTDNSLFCKVSRIFQIISWIFSVLIILFFVYVFAKAYFGSKRGGRSTSLF